MSVLALGLLYFPTPGLRADTTPGAPRPAAIDACALLQRAEITQIIGAPVGEPTRRDAGLASNGSFSSTCIWEIQAANPPPLRADAPLGGKSFVILNAQQWPRGSGLAHTFLDSFREAAKNGDIPNQTTPRKVGDEALWWGDGLAVRRHDVSFGVSVFFAGSKMNHTGAFEEQLAPHILRRLDSARAASPTNPTSRPKPSP
jgi:hypothetical protein